MFEEDMEVSWQAGGLPGARQTPTASADLPFAPWQYCEGEEPPGEDDYDDYSKELSQYRRSKEGRGRGVWLSACGGGGGPSGWLAVPFIVPFPLALFQVRVVAEAVAPEGEEARGRGGEEAEEEEAWAKEGA